MDRVSAF